jgi:uncharacterized protein
MPPGAVGDSSDVLGFDRDTCGRCRRGPIGAALLGAVLAALFLMHAGPLRAESYGDAMDWYGQAARSGDAEAQYLLGYGLETGVRGKVDPESAREWYRAAADQGHPRAALRLALMLLEGRGGPVDPLGAIAVLEPAAEGGDSDAQSLLGWLLATSAGDRIVAYRWLKLAAEAGDGAAAANLATLMNAMPDDRLAAAEAALQDWRASH